MTIASNLFDWLRPMGGPSDQTKEQAATTTGGGNVPQAPVVVWIAENLLEAEVIKSHLESEEIPAYLRGDVLGSIYGLTQGALARVAVLVPALFAEKAQVILHEEIDEDAEPLHGNVYRKSK